MNEGDVVHACRQVRKQLADPLPALPVPAEGERTLHQSAGLAEECVNLALAGEFLAVVLFEVRLVVERIDVTDAAGAEDLHDTANPGNGVRRGPAITGQQPRQRDAAETGGGLPEEMAAGEGDYGSFASHRRDAFLSTSSSPDQNKSLFSPSWAGFS